MNENVNENPVVRMPIVTTREGQKITKTCVEDVYKIINRVIEAMDKAHNNSTELIDTLQHDEYGEDSAVVFGTGTSQPCLTDAFDEEIGNNIAFMKMKLNANIKKHNLLCKIYNNYLNVINLLYDEIDKVDDYILLDLNGVRKHNPDYLSDLEEKLGIELSNNENEKLN